MIKNYITIALRNIERHRVYAFVNILGLAIGMACCILILLWVIDELSFDRYHKNADRIYRLCLDANMDYSLRGPVSSTPAALVLKEDFPEVLDAVRIDYPQRMLVKYRDKGFYQNGIIYADNSIFNVFTFPLIRGNPGTALEEPYTVVITETVAEKFFGDEDPLGKVMRFDDTSDYTVTGVMKDVPINSHLSFTIVCSMETHYVEHPEIMEEWLPFHFYTYLLLAEGTEPSIVEEKFPALIDTYLSPYSELAGAEIEFFLQRLTDIHLHSNTDLEIASTGNITYVYLFSAIALFILLMACFNFINLSTARSATRAREVGMRKTFGADRGRLIRQFIGESTLHCLFAIILSFVFLEAALPLFNTCSGRPLATNYFRTLWFIPGCLGFAVVVGHLAGGYPAFFLSSFKPVRVLRGTLAAGASHSSFRRVLVILQFVISVSLIIGTITIYEQLAFMKNKKLGYDKRDVLVLPFVRAPDFESFISLKEGLKTVPGVVNATVTDRVPGFGSVKIGVIPEGWGEDKSQLIRIISIDPDYLATMGMELVAGRNFSREIASDTTESVIINETAVRAFGWDDPIGKTITMKDEADTLRMSRTRRVIGVVGDFHLSSLHSPIEPLIFEYSPVVIFPEDYRMLAVRLAPLDVSETIELLSQKWDELVPSRPLDYFFLDDAIGNKYWAEMKLGKLGLYFSMLAVLIGCLGLFGMSAYSAEQRTKEVGIRKALGASVGGVVRLLSKEFLILVAIANLIAWPIAYLAMSRWLDNFAYHTELGWGVFLLAGVLSVTIALLTVIFQAYKAARANPVDALRYE
ncbi:MAG: ABC transporter permease [Candidatus Glassbacteria bacterium]